MSPEALRQVQVSPVAKARGPRHWSGQMTLGVAISGSTALLLALFADPLAHRFPFFCFYPGIILSGWLASTVGGTAATLLSGLLIQLHWFGSPHTQLIRRVPADPIEYAALGIFVVTGVAISMVQGRLRDTRDALRADIARRELVEQALRESAERNAEANRLKDDFLASLSHELRTPLNVVLGYSRMLQARECRSDCPASQQVDRWLSVLERNATTQMRLVEDLLDVQRIVTGRLSLERTTCNLADLAGTVVESLRPASDAKGLHFGAQIDSVIIDGDAARLQQVMWNLLANAIKFTPPDGCVWLGVGLREGSAVIRVDDSGEGIPPDFLPHVFERFQQLDTSRTRRHFGMGLGLAIVKHVVELHGGTVAAESAGKGKGATFTVTLPVAPAQGSQQASDSAEDSAGPTGNVA
jgi:signal transduction histidine kinase